MRNSLTRLLVALALAGPLTACKQALGDRCQLDTDCDSDLVCAVPSGARGAGGTCQPALGTSDMAGQDLANTAAPDFLNAVQPDMTMVPDLSTPDLASPGDGGPAGD